MPVRRPPETRRTHARWRGGKPRGVLPVALAGFIAVGAIAAPGSLAYFTESTSTGTVSVSTGRAGLAVGGPSIALTGALHPGAILTGVSPSVTNTGSVPLTLDATLSIEGPAAISDWLDVGVASIASDATCSAAGIAEFGRGPHSLGTVLAPDAAAQLCLVVTMAGDAPANSQVTGQVTVNVLIDGTQTR
jgi:hypothetical protein